jgi:hypothetical protein
VSNNYTNNGSIISINNINNEEWIIRNHIQRIQLGDNYKIEGQIKKTNINIYQEPDLNNSIIIGNLNSRDFINIEQVAEIKINNIYFVWLNIVTDNNIKGWIYFGKYDYDKALYNVPYFNNRWEILDYIYINDRIWTIRNMNNQQITIWNKIVNIHDKPGLIDTNIIARIIPPENIFSVIYLNIISATEEEENIDVDEFIELIYFTDRWLKINYNGIEGWIYGGYTSAVTNEEGVMLKYYTPENIISFHLEHSRNIGR